MTTSWGTGRNDASSAACLMTAAAVAEDQARADALWKPLDAAGQAAVLWSLAAHWRRLLVHQAAPGVSAATRGHHFMALLHALGRCCCDPVREFALAALAALDIQLSAPRCRPCTRVAAQTLCQAQLHFADAAGWPRQHLTEICRHPAT
jgi:hypothetical protein